MKPITVSEKSRKALLKLGLTEKEVSTYLVLLQKGPLSIQDISRATKINRVTIYAAVEILKNKGLVVQSKHGKRAAFLAENPNSLLGLLRQKRQSVLEEEKALKQLVLPNLKLISQEVEEQPRVSFYQGLHGINWFYDQLVPGCKSKNLIGCGSYETALLVTSSKDEKSFWNRLRKKKILYRVILEDTPVNREFAQLGKGIMHVKYLPLGSKVTADIHVFDDYVSLMSYETKVTTLIEEASIAQSLRVQLEFMWDRL